MRGNSHVSFLGEDTTVTPCPYPTLWAIHPGDRAGIDTASSRAVWGQASSACTTYVNCRWNPRYLRRAKAAERL
jgi:hypothetical protein